ncbi:glycosyltransferase family 2 protein [Nitratidesulfovibrio liaohensis]|uniref:Glycosyltransferase n=1 Tax=Nitratidesulfovibrio liaohensis TaxID=2604158 RepID=A0ABY9R1L2_9BACT|nr:glycosyltransferase family 2 protein [Nitratidesulfovibrio liaohensis]WMW65037.1 glycosyltransferase [Nitratidesulfovibrio liaohensis]
MHRPFLSIVIATRNAAHVLEKCLASLAAQNFRDFEVVIQDSASTDETVALASRFILTLPEIMIASEPDSGIYDAWNKATPRLRGTWTLFLGSDDRLASSNVLEQCAAKLAKLAPQVRYACGDACHAYEDGSTAPYPGRAEGALARMGEQIPFCHSSLWHRTSLFTEYQFDPAFRIAADYDFICRTWPHDSVGYTLEITVTHMGIGGLSTHPKSRLRTLWEIARIAHQHGHPVLTARRVIPLLKAVILWGACVCAGAHGPALLDRLRKLRGLPPCWTTSATHQVRPDTCPK